MCIRILSANVLTSTVHVLLCMYCDELTSVVSLVEPGVVSDSVPLQALDEQCH